MLYEPRVYEHLLEMEHLSQMEPLGTPAPASAGQENGRQQASLPIEFPELSLEHGGLETEFYLTR